MAGNPFGAVVLLAFAAAELWAAPTTIVDNGPSANRVDAVFLGDGYTQANLNAGIYDAHLQIYLDYMFDGGNLADPFPRYSKFVNVHKIDVVSNQSGADIPSQGTFRDTALDATYETDGIERLLTIDTNIADNIVASQLAGTGITADMRFATVNHTKYGGSGGYWSVYAGGNISARDVALHELGHSFSGLADEYVSFDEPYTDPEPSEPNVTADPTGQKWSHWLGFDDPRGSSLDIGVFEGAYYHETDVYRPSSNSKMRSLNQPFNAVSREALIHSIYDLVDPLDDWLDNSGTITGEPLWVDVVDPDVILVEWYVDEVLVEGATGEQFNLEAFGFEPGTYTVRAHAYDEIVDHAYTGGMLDLVRTGLESLQQDVSWTHTVPEWLLGDYNHDDSVDDGDFLFWRTRFGSDAELDADGNENGLVDAADYTIWRDHWGDSRNTGAGIGIQSVPEPGSAQLAIVALVVGCGVVGSPASWRCRFDRPRGQSATYSTGECGAV